MSELFGEKLFKQIEKLIQQVADIMENHEKRITNLEAKNAKEKVDGQETRT